MEGQSTAILRPTSKSTDCIVRIHATDGRTVGTGFLVPGGSILTCAHVVTDAGGGPGSEVKVSFYAESTRNPSYRTATVVAEHWRPPELEDLAILALSLSSHLEEEWVSFAPPFATHFEKEKLRYTTFGFPSAKNMEGLPGACDFIAETTENGFPVLVMRSEEVSLGFSGAPIWDSSRNTVVGVITSLVRANFDPERRQPNTCFGIPTRTVWAAYPHLRPSSECPFQSLEYFSAEKSDLYFGRSAIVRDMVSRLESSNFLAVLGISGSGKSSLVRAGLKQGLARYGSPELRGSRTIVFTPASRPLVNLVIAVEKALAGAAPPGATPGSSPPLFSEAPKDLDTLVPVPKVVERLKEALQGSRTIIVVDQFEQCFSADDRHKIERFMEAVRGLVGDNLSVMLALRADFYGVILSQPVIADGVIHSSLTVTPMTPEEIRDAIEGPLAHAGLAIQPRLVEELILESYDRPGDLPLLQFALTEVWKLDAATGLLSMDTFNSLGYKPGTPMSISGIKGIVVRRAEEEWDNLTPGDKEIAKSVFMHLVSVSSASVLDQALTADGSRRSWAAEWSPEMLPVVDKLAASFLLTRGIDPSSQQGTLQVSHEALIRSWPRLQQWVSEYRPYLLWQDQVLTPLLRNWLRQGQRPADLLDDVQVSEAEQWLSKYPKFFKGVDEQYVRASIARRDQARAAELLRKKLVIGAASLAALIFILLSSLAFQGRARANAMMIMAYDTRALGFSASNDILNAETYFAAETMALEEDWFNRRHSDDDIRARSGFVEAAAHGLKFDGSFDSGTKNPTLLRSFDASNGNGPPSSTRLRLIGSRNGSAVLQDAASNGPPATTIFEGDQDTYLAAAGARSARYAVARSDGSVVLAQVTKLTTHTQPVPACVGKKDGAVSSLTLSDDGNYLAVGCELSKIVVVFDLTEWDHVRKMYVVQGFDDPVNALAVSPDAHWVASGSRDRSVKIWQLTKGRASLKDLGRHADVVLSVAFSPDSRLLASGSKDLTIRVDDIETGESRSLAGSQGGVGAIAFSPGGRFLASAATDRQVRIWNVASGKEWAKLDTCLSEEHATASQCATPTSIQFESDQSLSVSLASGSIYTWKLESANHEVSIIEAHRGAANVAQFSPDGKYLATGGQDGKVLLWNLADLASPPQALHRGKDADNVIWLAYSKDGARLAAGDEDDHVHVWNLKDEHLVELNRQLGAVWALDFSYDGLLATGDANGCVHLWKETEDQGYVDVDRDLPQSKKFCARGGSAILSLAFSDDHVHFAAGHRDGSVILWNLRVRDEPTVVKYDGSAVWAVAFSPGGRYLASGGEDAKVHVYDTITKAKTEVGEHEGEVWTLAYSSQGLLASGGEDGCLRLWSFQDGKPVTIRDRDATILGLGFDGTGENLALAELDGIVHIWHLNGLRSLLNARAEQMVDRAKRDSKTEFRGDLTGLVYQSK